MYLAPWKVSNVIDDDQIDFIFSLSVLEHLSDPGNVYKCLYKWLKPGGIICHKIDHSSHGITKIWNGHYWLPSFLWKIIVGKRSYLLNRLTPCQHKKLMENNGFEVIKLDCSFDYNDKSFDGFPLNSCFKKMEESELYAKTTIIIAKKTILI